jgi:glycine cleavage system H lipoate-binding protein
LLKAESMITTEKQTDQKNQIWFYKDGDLVRVGFTNNFIQRMDECWHILPYGKGKIAEKDPLMAVETNDELVSIAAPVAGILAEFSNKAMNFPDKLTADDVIVSLNTNPKATTPVQERRAGILGNRGFAMNWDIDVVQREREEDAPETNALPDWFEPAVAQRPVRAGDLDVAINRLADLNRRQEEERRRMEQQTRELNDIRAAQPAPFRPANPPARPGIVANPVAPRVAPPRNPANRRPR